MLVDKKNQNLYGDSMKKRTAKFLRITGFVLIAVTLRLMTVFVCAGFVHTEHSIGIIGGADAPTAAFLLSRFKWKVLLTLGGSLSGIFCIIISSFVNKNSTK